MNKGYKSTRSATNGIDLILQFSFICFLVLSSISTNSFAQTIDEGSSEMIRLSYDLHLKDVLEEKLTNYESTDTTIINIKNIIDLYETSVVPPERIKLLHGIAFVLTDEDCHQLACSSPKIYAALIYEEDNRFNICAVRDKYTKEPPNPEYVNHYIANNFRYSETSIIQHMLRATKPEYLTGFLFRDPQEHTVIDENSLTFLRQSKGWIIGMSTDRYLTHERIIVYLFRTTVETLPEEDILLVDSSRKMIAKKDAKQTSLHPELAKRYVNIERKRNPVSNMIETIVNHHDIQDYYHGNEFFIVSNNLFSYNLDIKHQGRDIWIIPYPHHDVLQYLQFNSNDYQPGQKYVNFDFSYPSEGVTGNALFELKGPEYSLKEMNVFE